MQMLRATGHARVVRLHFARDRTADCARPKLRQASARGKASRLDFAQISMFTRPYARLTGLTLVCLTFCPLCQTLSGPIPRAKRAARQRMIIEWAATPGNV